MKIKFLLLVFSLFISHFSMAQNQWNAGVGFNYGGPIPTEMDTLSEGLPLPGLCAGISYRIPISKRFWFAPDFSYNFRHFNYKSIQKKDTLVDVEIAGNKVTVPTYFTARVEGHLITHHFDLKLPVHWRFKDRMSVGLGPYASWVFTGLDSNTVDVQIGEGSLIDNVEQSNTGFEGINPLEFGIILSGASKINNKFSLQIDCSRSLTSFYEKGYYESLNDGKEVRFYPTYVFLSIRYNL